MSSKNSSNVHSSDENDEEIESDTGEQQRSEIREELAAMTFEEILKIKEKMGSRLYNKLLSGDERTRKPLKIKRANKNRPQEISSKIRPKIIKKTLVTPTKPKEVLHRDPRFDTLCGTFDKDKFQTDYKFIYDLQEKEQKLLEKEEKQEHNVERKKKLKSAIQRLVSINKKLNTSSIWFLFQKNKSNEKKKNFEQHQKKMQNKLDIKEKLKQGEAPIKPKKSELQFWIIIQIIKHKITK